MIKLILLYNFFSNSLRTKIINVIPSSLFPGVVIYSSENVFIIFHKEKYAKAASAVENFMRNISIKYSRTCVVQPSTDKFE